MIRQRYLTVSDLCGRPYTLRPSCVIAVLPTARETRCVVQTTLGVGSVLVDEEPGVVRERLDAAWENWESSE